MCHFIIGFSSSRKSSGYRTKPVITWLFAIPQHQRSWLWPSDASLLVPPYLQLVCIFHTSMLPLNKLEPKLEMILLKRDWERNMASYRSASDCCFSWHVAIIIKWLISFLKEYIFQDSRLLLKMFPKTHIYLIICYVP